MPGNTKSLLVLLHILLWDLAVCYARVKDETSTIHWIPRENGTAIPEEYKDLPLVAKCCPNGQIFIKNGTHHAVCEAIHSTAEYSFAPIFYNFNKSGYEIPGEEHSTFVAITGDPCKYKRYMLDPDETSDDNNYLLANGSVFAPHHEPSMLMPGVDYCMETVPHIGLKTFVCFPEAFVIQFSFVACFFWLNAMCIEMWSLVHSYVEHETDNRMKPKTLFFWYSLWCWGPPVILILVSMIMDLSPTIPATYVKPNFGKESCWFESSDEAMPYFYAPVGLLLLGNVTLFIMTFIKLSKYQKDLDLRRLARNEETDRRDRSLLRRYTRMAIVGLIIFFLMGLNWTMELISWFVDADSFDWSMFDLVNALQGVLVFGLFVIRRPQRDFVWHRIQQLRGIDTTPPQAGSMESYLLPMLNGDTVPGQTIIP
ncbi:putative G-protein coupled receptor Mth-like 10 isoform X3 [Augochlora pura]